MAKQAKKSDNPNYRTIEQLISYHNQAIIDSNKISVENVEEPAFTYVVNASGGKLCIADLEARDKDSESQKIIELEAGEIINLNSWFSKSVINRNKRTLIEAFKMKGGVAGLPSLLCVESALIEFPVSLINKSLVDKVKEKGLAGSPVEMPENEFDKRLDEEYAKEETYNKKIMARSGKQNVKRQSQEDFDKKFS